MDSAPTPSASPVPAVGAGAEPLAGSGAGRPSSGPIAVGRPARCTGSAPKAPLRGALVVGASTPAGLADRLQGIGASGGPAEHWAAPPAPPASADLAAAERIAIDYADPADLAVKIRLALGGLHDGRAASWRALQGRGVFRGHGPAPPVAFLLPGQGSQYTGMLTAVRALDPVVDRAVDDADAAIEPILGTPLSVLTGGGGGEGERWLRNTAIAQPAVLAVDLALARLLGTYGITPDVVAGHSLGEYAAVAAAGGLTSAAAFELASAIPHSEALDAVAPLQGSAPRRVPLTAFDGGAGPGPRRDRGTMAAVLAPAADVARIIAPVPGYVVVANVNSTRSTVIGGETPAVGLAVEALTATGIECMPLPVGAAFHTRMVEAAVPALRRALVRSGLRPPQIPVIANLTGERYPEGARALPQVLRTLAPQFATPMSFVACVETLWAMGVRIFVEVGPKRVVQGFVQDVIGDRQATVLFTNHPKVGEVAAFNAALCGLWAAGLGQGCPVP